MNNLTCSICGKNFNNIDDYLKCVTACTKKYKEKELTEKKAQAEAEAKSMTIRANALTKNKALVEYEAVQRWDGKLPQYMMGNTVPFINLNNSK